ncbi:hypothetical protein AB0L53_09360 [Nonomuraea sp. NPDC052129]|uniref:hypothetical protein n=1 Tax=Nonomuraea sp. NPDC052129 TaxID=3154651 RepID=UPI00341E9E90
MTEPGNSIVPLSEEPQQDEPTPGLESTDADPPADVPPEGEQEEPLLSQAIFNEAVGAAFVGSRIDNLYLSETRRTVSSRALHKDVLRKLREVYVRVDREGVKKADEITRFLREKPYVVLRGESGSGRRIAAINAAMDINMRPIELLIDPDDIDQSLASDANRGYFIVLSEIEEQAISKFSNVLPHYVARLWGVSSRLIIIATPNECRLLDLEDHVVVRMIGPASEDVFQSHLSFLTSRSKATEWAKYAKIKKVLDVASTREATQLANKIKEKSVEEGVVSPELVEEVLSSYYDPAEHLEASLSAIGDTDPSASEYAQALLFATATLEGSRPEDIFTATDKLVQFLDIETYPGRGIFGPGVAKLLLLIDAKLSNNEVTFRRPGCALPVIDHMWTDRIYLRKHLGQWLIHLGAESEKASSALLHLATSQYAQELVTEAVTSWTANAVGRRRAVELLTAASLSNRVGRDIRQKLYYWSISAPTEEVQIAVAEVCGGPLGIVFPRIALTRLRHLAGRRSTRLRGTVCAAIAELGRHRGLLRDVLVEVLSWLDKSADEQTTGVLAFSTLANLRDANRFLLVPESPGDDETIRAVAMGWRTALRNQETELGAAQIASAWLEATAQAQAPRQVVIEVFAKACINSYDIGIIVPLAHRWERETSGHTEIPRQMIREQLEARISELNPRLWGNTPITIYSEIKERHGSTDVD